MLAYKCRDLTSDSDKKKISEILSGRIDFYPDYSNARTLLDPDNNRVHIEIGSPIGMQTLKMPFHPDQETHAQVPYYCPITMPKGCLWHASPDRFEDHLDINPEFEAMISPSNILRLINPHLRDYAFLLKNEKIKDICESLSAEMLKNIRTSGVCSLSKSFSNPLLWEKYGANGCGIALEFDIPGIKSEGFYEAKYFPEDKRPFARLDEAINAYFEGSNSDSLEEFVNSIFCAKTLKWEFENEIRHITVASNQYAYIGSIRKIILGHSTSEEVAEWLKSAFPEYEYALSVCRGGMIEI